MQGQKILFSSKNVEWRTPPELFNKLNEEFHFTLDPASTDENCLCEKHYTQKENGLIQNWDGETVFLNSPYGRSRKTGIYAWIEKAAQIRNGTAVCIVPVRTGVKWWQNFILNHAEIRFLPGRIRFLKPDGSLAPHAAGFDTAVVVYRNEHMKRGLENGE